MTLFHPYWLFALLLVPAIALAAALSPRFCRRRWAAFVSDRLRPTLLLASGRVQRILALVFLSAAIAALVLALARPQGDAGTRVEKNAGRNVMIALDLSRSMRATDVKPDRLSQAKVVIEEMLEAMPGERFGLIGFGGNAYLYAPLTNDHAAVREVASQIDETWMPLGGTDIRKVLRLSIDTLKQTGQHSNALVFISDADDTGRNPDVQPLIEEAKRAGIYILAVGVGTEQSSLIPDKNTPGGFVRDVNGNGDHARSKANLPLLRAMATGTNGRFALAGTGLDIPDMVASVVKDLDASDSKTTERRIVVEYFQWLVLPAILFLMGAIVAGTRWRKARPAAISALLVSSFLIPRAEADAVHDARRAFDGKQWENAARSYKDIAETPERPADYSQSPWWKKLGQRLKEERVSPFPQRKALFQLGRGEAEYQRKHYRQAVAGYSQALASPDAAVRSRAHAGIANSLFQRGWFTLSAGHYSAPDTKDFTTFDKLVKDYLDGITMALLSPQTDEGPSIQNLRGMITDWSDAVRHWETASRTLPGDEGLKTNAALARAYLKRLQELLKEQEQQQQQGGQGQGDGSGPPGEGGGGSDPGDGDGGQDGDESDDGSNGPPEKDDGGAGDEGDDRKPGETPEEQALRKLEENSDLERGPVSPGRSELHDPPKDW